MSSEPLNKRQKTSAAVGDIFASGSSTIHQIGAIHSVNTTINAPAPLPWRQKDPQEADCLESLTFKGIYSKNRTVEFTPGTCSWILDHLQFQSWLSKPGTILWIEGHPGAGKSSIVKFLVQYESEQPQERSVSCSFFFNALGEQEEKTTSGLLSSLLYELALRNRTCLKAVTRAFQKNCKLMGRFEEKWQWAKGELKALASEALRELTSLVTVRIYVDAVDEAGDPDEVLDFFEDLLAVQNISTPALSICISCRHHPNLKRRVNFTIDLASQSLEDLEIHASFFLRGLRANDERKKAIQRLVVSHSNRIFQWLVLVLPQVRTMIQDGDSDSDIRQKLQELPAELDALYLVLLQSIRTDRRSQALKLCQWLCFAHRPLNLSEIRVALAFDQDDTWDTLEDFCGPNNDHWIEDESQINDLVKSLSKGLVSCIDVVSKRYDGSLRNRSKQVVFIHQSVQDFMKAKGLALLSHSTADTQQQPEAGQTRLYRSCLKYMTLCSYALPKIPDPRLIVRVQEAYFAREEPFALGKYAIFNWARHAKNVALNLQPQDEIMSLLQIKSIELMELWLLFDDCFFSNHGINLGMNVLHMCSFLGLIGVVKRILARNEIRVDSKDMVGRTPLHYAAMEAEPELFHSLLETGQADPHFEDDGENTPFSHVIYSGNTEMVEMLFNWKGFDPNYRNKDGDTLLVDAVRSSRVDAIRLLLSSGKVDLDVKTGDGIPLLCLAIEAHEHADEICRLLLDTRRIDPNVGNEYNPLHLAVYRNKVEIIELLSNYPNVNLNVRDSRGRTVLHNAAKFGNAEMVRKLLIAENVDVRIRDNKSRTALHQAAKYNHEVVRLLLDNADVDPFSTDELGRTALHFAAMKDQAESTSLLLDTGLISPMPIDVFGHTPLSYAKELLCYGVLREFECNTWTTFEDQPESSLD